MFLNSYNITRNVNNMQGRRGGFTVAWFVAMFENLTKSVSHMVCLIWKFSGVVEGPVSYTHLTLPTKRIV